MNCFERLGINPTNNIRDIKKAYSLLLKVYHPEEYPEEFKEIHKAYEEALDYAKNHKNQENVFEQELNIVQFYPKEDQNEETLGDFKDNNLLYINDDNEENKFKDVNSHVENVIYEEYENKFKAVEEYEIHYTQKEKEVIYLIEMLEWQKRKYGSPQKNFFETPIFLKYYLDSMFIEKYIKVIHNGLYDNLNSIEKKRLNKIHKKLYFYHISQKLKYQSLYYELYPYIFNKKGSGIEICLFILLVFITAATSNMKTATTFLLIEICLLTFYTIMIPVRVSKHPSERKIKRFIQYRRIMIVIFVCIMSFNYIQKVFFSKQGQEDIIAYKEQFLNFGQFDYNTKADYKVVDLKQIENQYATVYIDEQNKCYININQENYNLNYSYEDIQDFVYYNNNLYYIYSHDIYLYRDHKKIMSCDKTAVKYQFIVSQEYCLLIEELKSIVNIYQFTNNHFEKLYTSQELYGLCHDKYLYLKQSQLYHFKESSQYLWCFDVNEKKDEETVILIDGLISIDGIEKEVFLNYDGNPHFLDGLYIFQGQVLYFVNLQDGYFCYINDRNILYVVNSYYQKEIIGLDLTDICKEETLEISHLVGEENHIVIKYNSFYILNIKWNKI